MAGAAPSERVRDSRGFSAPPPGSHRLPLTTGRRRLCVRPGQPLLERPPCGGPGLPGLIPAGGGSVSSRAACRRGSEKQAFLPGETHTGLAAPNRVFWSPKGPSEGSQRQPWGAVEGCSPSQSSSHPGPLSGLRGAEGPEARSPAPAARPRPEAETRSRGASAAARPPGPTGPAPRRQLAGHVGWGAGNHGNLSPVSAGGSPTMHNHCVYRRNADRVSGFRAQHFTRKECRATRSCARRAPHRRPALRRVLGTVPGGGCRSSAPAGGPRPGQVPVGCPARRKLPSDRRGIGPRGRRSGGGWTAKPPWP